MSGSLGRWNTPAKPVSTPKPKVILKAKSRLKILTEAAAKVEKKNEKRKDPSHVPWADKHHPNNLEELFVNKKKVEEVQLWLQNALELSDAKSSNFRKSKVCILSGPSGSGKTACIMSLAKYFNLAVKEWICPSNLTDYDATKVFTYGDEITGQSQTDLFTNFLFRSSQYSSLPIKGKVVQANWITIVEDFPTVFSRDASLFHNILRNLSSTSTPVVFIIGDTNSGDNNANKLFPKNIRDELGIPLITFNSIAPTFMVKYLTVVCAREDISLPKSIIEEIAAVSSGDMRSAINSLQFTHQKSVNGRAKSTFKKPFPPGSKASKGNNKGESTKDESLFLFHALGKVLYGKRNINEMSRSENDLVPRLSNEKRLHPLANIPEELSNMIEVSAETFVYFLQQNFIQFFTSLEECVKASAHLADAEHVLSNWAFDSSNNEKSFKVKGSKEEIALSVAARGLMHANTKPVSQTWKPLRKPICNDLPSRIQKSVDSYLSLCPVTTECLQMNFYTDYFPYFAKIKGSSLSADKRQLLLKNSIGSKNNKYRFDDTNLEDMHNFELTKDEVNWGCSANGAELQQEVPEDAMEFNIEDYDDE